MRHPRPHTAPARNAHRRRADADPTTGVVVVVVAVRAAGINPGKAMIRAGVPPRAGFTAILWLGVKVLRRE